MPRLLSEAGQGDGGVMHRRSLITGTTGWRNEKNCIVTMTPSRDIGPKLCVFRLNLISLSADIQSTQSPGIVWFSETENIHVTQFGAMSVRSRGYLIAASVGGGGFPC